MSHFISLLFVLASSTAFAAVPPNVAADPVPNFHQITQQIYRGGRPTPEGLKSLKEAGIKSIINLENVAGPVQNERAQAKALGMGFMSSPMSWITPPTDQQIDKILAVMSNPENQPVYIHCLHGRDRTGLVSALYRVLIQKMSAREAYSEMKQLGFRSLFVTLEWYYRQRTGYWDFRFNSRAPVEYVYPQDRPENRNVEMDGEQAVDELIPADPSDLQR